VNASAHQERWAYLNAPELARRLLDFSDAKTSRITFHIPAIHCIACVWLLENLFQLHPAIGRSQVNFPKREVAINFTTGEIKLSQLIALLASLGYEPKLTLSELEKNQPNAEYKHHWLQLGLAGFAFGNVMLFSLPLYLGLDSLSGPAFRTLFGWLSLALALPVVIYSASDYWRSAFSSVWQRVLTLDVPIALGLAAIYAESFYEISAGVGPGYCDSLTGLIFLLLCGRVFQRKTYDRMTFDRDYKCFFPLSVVRRSGAGEETMAISQVRPGDRLVLRNRELIPADATLTSGTAFIDYSFITGESQPVEKHEGDYLYAGGQQIGGAIEVQAVKPVSQSYLTSLWNHEAFQKNGEDNLNTLTNRYSRRFTRIVLGVAVASALLWFCAGHAPRAVKAFISVLIVACPCALALASPFALGTAQRLLARSQVFLKNGLVLERLARVDAIIFDKTGTLTTSNTRSISFKGIPLTPGEQHRVYSLARHSTHPLAAQISASLPQSPDPHPARSFLEIPGSGIEGTVDGHALCLGSAAWLASRGVKISCDLAGLPGTVVCLAMDGNFRGAYLLAGALRPEINNLIAHLNGKYEIALLSGDNERQSGLFREMFPTGASLRFNQSPLDKLEFISRLQTAGRTVMMVGDGLNDAGALKQSDVGVAVVEKIGAFSPASDVILEAFRVSQLFKILVFARRAVLIVRLSFAISALYNVVGIAIAAAGLLSPLVCAVLMPLSSVSVVLFACGAAQWAASRLGLTSRPDPLPSPASSVPILQTAS
jgi:Cu+-exporting ATPase